MDISTREDSTMDSEITSETTDKDWFRAVKIYHEQSFGSLTVFLDSAQALECGLNQEDIRAFRRAVQSFDTKWQAAAKAYIQGKFTTRKKFVSSGKFLKMGFSPSREHAEVLRFALKFYDEETKYRQNANSEAVTTAGRWGGFAKPITGTHKVRTPNQVIGFDKDVMENENAPTLVRLEDDMSFELSSSGSGESSITCSVFERDAKKQGEVGYVEGLLCDLCDKGGERNPVNGMIFFIFAVIPLVVFAKLGIVMTILFPGLKKKEVEEVPTDIESVWDEMRANICLVDGTY